ncbi:AMP-binding protein [Fodinicola feengrottensis]|uniref:AMP-binding protein n=1 Tax=Fodinicola feengrottensis TaxID=435914 RepID=UPI0013D7C6F2|nr:AMP-binding protein [Fodinicola feengrottensis]
MTITERTLTEVFRRTVMAGADYPAIIEESGTATYRELDRESDGIAAALHHKGVRPGELVCLEASRTRAGLAALLGILKAGAAYLPLEPSNPPTRLRDMVRTAAAPGSSSDRPYKPKTADSTRRTRSSSAPTPRPSPGMVSPARGPTRPT